MGVKYSDGLPVFVKGIRSNSSANLRADLDAAVLLAGWTDKTAITGGYKYTITSPQSLVAKVKIWDAGGTDYISVQFMSEDETQLGSVHRLVFGYSEYSALGYQLVANQCQVFIGIPGISTEQIVVGKHQHSIAGGIPYVGASVDPECNAEGVGDAVTRIFWSCGTGIQAFAVEPNFRNSRYCMRDYSHLVNSDLFVAPSNQAVDTSQGGQLSLFPLTPANNVDGSGIPPRVVKYGSGDPLFIDALVGWEWQIRGQLYDAFMATRDRPLDELTSTTEIDAGGAAKLCRWICWNYHVDVPAFSGRGTYLASLHLLVNHMTLGHNVAY